MEEEERERGQEEKERAVLEFEKVMMGMEGSNKKGQREILSEGPVEPDSPEKRGVKRKFQLDAEEVLRNTKVDRVKARNAIDEEKVAKFDAKYSRVRKMTCIHLGFEARSSVILGPLFDSVEQPQFSRSTYENVANLPCLLPA